MTSFDAPAPQVIQDLEAFLAMNDEEAKEEDDDASSSSVAMPVAAIKALLGVVQRSQAETMMGLQDELQQASEDMLRYAASITAKSTSSPSSLKHRYYSRIPVQSGCDLFRQYITRTFLELPNFQECKQAILERGKRFAFVTTTARQRIAHVGEAFIQEGMTVVTHGWSRVVAAVLLEAATVHGRQFDVVVLEGRPDSSGRTAAAFYRRHGIPTRLVLDSAMGYILASSSSSSSDTMVLVGAESVVENGGIVNKLGTLALALSAKAMGTPFYVAAESYKFARLFPLSQDDILPAGTTSRSGTDMTESSIDDGPIEIENPSVDYTPPKYITLLFTDLGVLTPSAVSDELIRLYQ